MEITKRINGWPHSDGAGVTVQLDRIVDMLPPDVRTEFRQTFASNSVPLGAAIPIDGRITLRVASEKKA